jgi:capsular polysaccharide biosynthesis protein
MKIETQYPINIEESDKDIFNEVREYEISIPKIKLLKNVFVTNNGFVVKNGILNAKSGLNLKSKHDHTFYLTYWRTALEQNIVCKFGKSIPSQQLKNKTYVLIHSKWLNYSFWITEYLQRLTRVEHEIGLKNLILLYPEEWDNIPYIYESLKAFQIEHFRIPAGHHLFIDNLVFPEVREITAYFYPEHIKLVRNRLLDEAKQRSQVTHTPKKIYLTRGINVKRAIANESELQESFRKHGFEIISFENLSIWDQITYMNNADILFTNHGAGFSNVIFMEPNKIALEFLEKDFAHYANPFPHWKLASAVDVNYAYQLCLSKKTKNISYQPLKKTNGEKRIEHVDRIITVNLELLEKNIKFCEDYLKK